ncbi:hypothetical protein ABK040_011815 [Willaertia magna]
MRKGIVKKKSNNKSKLIDGLKGRNLVFINEGSASNTNNGNTSNSKAEVMEVNPKYCQIAKSLKNSGNFSDNYFVMQLINNNKRGNNNRKENNVETKAVKEQIIEQNNNETELNHCNIMNNSCNNIINALDADVVNTEKFNREMECLVVLKNLLKQIEKNQIQFEISGHIKDSSTVVDDFCKSDYNFEENLQFFFP